jgi:predicted Zn-dependent protease
MRIICRQCSVAYSLDDRHVTERGVRAQCPRCRHLQLVKKGGPEDQPPAPTLGVGGSDTASAFGFDFSGPQPSEPEPEPQTQPAARPWPSGEFGASASQAVERAPFDFSALAPRASSSSSPFEFDATQPLSGADSGQGFPAFGPPEAAASEPSGRPEVSTPGGAPAGVSAPPCASCGRPLVDAFDLALGTCDGCREKQQGSASSESLPLVGLASQPSRGFPASPTGRSATPAAPDLLPRRASGSVEATHSGQDSAPVVEDHGRSSLGAASRAAAGWDPHGARSASAERDVRANAASRTRLAGIAVATVVVVGAGVLAVKRPWVHAVPVRVVQAPVDVRPKAIDAMVRRWRLRYPELQGVSSKNAAATLEAGEQALAKDTTEGYADAEEAFQKTLILDSSSERAVAGWALALAFGHGAGLDESTAKAAEGILEALELESGEPGLFAAHAHLLIARGGNSNDIQRLAERAMRSASGEEQALASLALGQAMLQKNTQTAERHFAKALELNPKLKRTHFFRAKLALSLGHYAEAVASLKTRLELDADQWEASRELSRLYVEVGDAGEAKRVLQGASAAAPRNTSARIALGALAYQHLGAPETAIELLSATTQDADLPKPELAEAWAHLAAAWRLKGDAAKASDAVNAAQELVPEHQPARLQHMLLMLDRGIHSQARLDFDNLKGEALGPGLERVLEGRLLMAEGRLEEAASHLAKVQEDEANRVDALLLAGAAAAKTRRDGKVWEYCLKRGLRADPTSYPVPALTEFFVRPADLLRPAVGAYAALNKGADEDPSPFLCEGLVAWYSQDYATAETHFARVISIDPGTGEAYAFRSMLALRKKDLTNATRMADRAIANNRSGALGHLAKAQALLSGNKLDAAKESVMNALKFSPSMVAARTLLGDIEARQGNKEEARRLLTSALLIDPLSSEAKRVLYGHRL